MGRGKSKMAWLVLIAAGAVAASGQSSRGLPTPPLPAVISVQAGKPPLPIEVIREIDDPHNGNRWLLERDSSRPGAPGRLVLVGVAEYGASEAGTTGKVSALPVIRAGDHIIVEENTSLVEARLEAVALNPALSGAPLKVRLVIGGRVLRALAVAPGRAELTPKDGQP